MRRAVRHQGVLVRHSDIVTRSPPIDGDVAARVVRHGQPSERHMSRLLALVLVLAMTPTLASAQTAADSAAIRATALDYIEGWYTADATRMERALHPELAKRIVQTDPQGNSRLGQQSAMTLVSNTRRGGGTSIPADKRKSDVRILDVYGNAASVRVQAASWVDYMHVAKSNGRWVIVNVLWELDPPPASASR
jgi:hypothetical protein